MGALHEDQCTFLIISRLVLTRMINVSNIEKIKTHLMFSNFFFCPKIVWFMR